MLKQVCGSLPLLKMNADLFFQSSPKFMKPFRFVLKEKEHKLRYIKKNLSYVIALRRQKGLKKLFCVHFIFLFFDNLFV